MALMAVRPVFRRLRLYNVEFSGGQRRTMFLSLSWGLMADIGQHFGIWQVHETTDCSIL
jgi:hypothetical protein